MERTVKRRRPRKKIQTITVYTRHSSDCKRKSEGGSCRKCNCVKYIRILKDGREESVSANTREWVDAEAKAQEYRDALDPVKQRLQALLMERDQKQSAQVTIDEALKRWVASATKKLDDVNSRRKYETAARKIAAWARYTDPVTKLTSRKDTLIYVNQITPDLLDLWVTWWKLNAERVEDRLGTNTASRHLEKVKGWLDYCVHMNWVANNPSKRLDPIRALSPQTLPLLDGRYEKVLDATYAFDRAQRRPEDCFGQEMRALFELQRWTGLRISDALMAARSRLEGNHFSLIPHKTRKMKAKLVVILPDHVVRALDALPQREGVDPRYFFWSGRSTAKSLTSLWAKKLARLNEFISLVDYEENPQPLKFHSHQLRDTFAVEHLLSGTSMEDVSKMLGHKSIKVTEKYYSAWVPARQAQLEGKMIAAIERMGAKVTLSQKLNPSPSLTPAPSSKVIFIA